MAAKLSLVLALCLLIAAAWAAPAGDAPTNATTTEEPYTEPPLPDVPAVIPASCAGAPLELQIPSPGACSKYLLCLPQGGVEVDCDDGLHFSYKFQACTWPELAECGIDA